MVGLKVFSEFYDDNRWELLESDHGGIERNSRTLQRGRWSGLESDHGGIESLTQYGQFVVTIMLESDHGGIERFYTLIITFRNSLVRIRSWWD